MIRSPYRHIKTELPVTETQGILKDLMEYEPRALQGQSPLIWERAEGIHVFDKSGNKWLDWSSGVLVTNVGHSHPEIIRSIEDQLKQGLLFSYYFPTEVRSKLVKRLARLTPEPLKKVLLLSTGSEATEVAIKLSKTYGKGIGGSSKNILISFDLGFHGRTMGAQMSGGNPNAKTWINSSDYSFIQVPFPDGYRYSDLSFTNFEKSLKQLGVSGHDVAGVIIESYLGGGASFAPKKYIQKLRSWCNEYNVILTFDEVQAGFGRTGKMFAFEHYDVVPDLLCLGKGISSSLPLSAVVGRKDIMDIYPPGSMSSTHGGNPICCAAALANLNVIQKSKLVEHSSKIGDYFRSELDKVLLLFPEIIGTIHGRGLVYALHIIKKGTTEPNPQMAKHIISECFVRGLLMFAPVGYKGANIKICPPLTITKEAIEDGIGVLRDVLNKVRNT